MIILSKKFPVVYNREKYYVKISKYNFLKYENTCITSIYKRLFFLNIKLHEEKCSYSDELTDNDFQYFTEETIKRYLKQKQHEDINKTAFKKWNGVCK